MTIDPASVRISLPPSDGFTIDNFDGGVAPDRWSYEDVSGPDDINGDSFVDLVLKFKTQELFQITLTKFIGQTIDLTINGNLKEEFSGTRFTGQDEVLILGKNG